MSTLRYSITVGGQARAAQVSRDEDGRFRVVLDGVVHVVDLVRPTPDAFHMLIDGQSWEAGAAPREGGWLIDVLGLSTEVDVVDPRRAVVVRSAARGGKVVTAQMPGRVVRVLVASGDTVRKGQPLLVLEAMKMENELKAAADGLVVELYVTEGQAVELGARLARLE